MFGKPELLNAIVRALDQRISTNVQFVSFPTVKDGSRVILVPHFPLRKHRDRPSGNSKQMISSKNRNIALEHVSCAGHNAVSSGLVAIVHL